VAQYVVPGIGDAQAELLGVAARRTQIAISTGSLQTAVKAPPDSAISRYIFPHRGALQNGAPAAAHNTAAQTVVPGYALEDHPEKLVWDRVSWDRVHLCSHIYAQSVFKKELDMG
jgi:sugar (pentulose or hexulose) kinase